MRLPATGCFRHRDRLGHRGSRHRIQRPNQVAGPGNSHGCRHRRRDDWRPEDLWPGDVERPLPLTRRPGDGGRGQRRAASAVRNPDRTRGATSASGRCCVRGPVDGRRFRIRSQKAHYATSRSLKNRLLESAQPRWRWADDGARRDVVHQRDIADGTGVEPATHR